MNEQKETEGDEFLMIAQSAEPSLLIPEQLQPFWVAALRYIYQPVPPCIYFLSEGQNIVYVGQSVSLPARLTAHQVDKRFDDVHYIPVSRSDLNVAETFFIHLLRPALNRTSRGSYGREVRSDETAAFLKRFYAELSNGTEIRTEAKTREAIEYIEHHRRKRIRQYHDMQQLFQAAKERERELTACIDSLQTRLSHAEEATSELQAQIKSARELIDVLQRDLLELARDNVQLKETHQRLLNAIYKGLPLGTDFSSAWPWLSRPVREALLNLLLILTGSADGVGTDALSPEEQRRRNQERISAFRDWERARFIERRFGPPPAGWNRQ